MDGTEGDRNNDITSGGEDFTSRFLKARIFEVSDPAECSLVRSKPERGAIRLRIKINFPKADPVSYKFVLSYDRKLDADASAWLLPADYRNGILTADIPLTGLYYKQTHWSVWLHYESEEGDNLIPVELPLRSKLNAMFRMFAPQIAGDGDEVMFLRRKPNGIVGLVVRNREDYDSAGFRMKECAAALSYALLKPFVRRRRILLIHEKRYSRASDNGLYLFLHCMKNGAEKKFKRKIYYVIDKNSPDYRKVSDYEGNVVHAYSLRHLISLLACTSIASTESRMHDYVWFPAASILKRYVNRKRHIFLGHGVLSIKKLPEMFSAQNMRSSLITCVSENEAAIFRDDLEYSEEKIAITGYARFDALKDISEGRSEVLIMPSIRANIFWVTEKEFRMDPYYKVYTGILNDPALHETLENNDLWLNFFLHPSIDRFAHLFESGYERIHVVKAGEESLDGLMMRARLLITDYSSVAWDFLYMGKPILFFQYDEVDFLEASGSYIDLAKALPGDRATDANELIRLLCQYAREGLHLPEKYQQMRLSAFKWFDCGSSERIINEIEERAL